MSWEGTGSLGLRAVLRVLDPPGDLADTVSGKPAAG